MLLWPFIVKSKRELREYYGPSVLDYQENFYILFLPLQLLQQIESLLDSSLRSAQEDLLSTLVDRRTVPGPARRRSVRW